ncbi:hypothetical protein BC939DRAFT_446682 [Gamsiella multidivaricata]|uniref:uncharacterized protein n=1 Tax=Gamsiella multidivaricata TaxID=101098 RepID=UPI002220FBC4|nr:uncharacterized protein BC939DRAFT_446682 [Gamsiella multidivaricata]KAI7826538.1 hypothetical protein BC939DRAFT_446682 [Gamsiella multidivaricata]
MLLLLLLWSSQSGDGLIVRPESSGSQDLFDFSCQSKTCYGEWVVVRVVKQGMRNKGAVRSECGVYDGYMNCRRLMNE